MKNAWRARAAVVIVSAFTVIGCDSTQPDRIETRTAVLSLETRGIVTLWGCYESPFPRCFQLFNPAVPPNPATPRTETRTLPWRYSVKITLIRAGTVDEVPATSLTGVLGSSVEPGDVVDDFISLGNYDEDSTATVPDRTEGGITYTNGHLVSSASPIYLATIFIDPGLTNLLEVPPATPTVAPTFEFTLNTGDTVIVRARKQANGDAAPVVPQYEGVVLSGNLTLSGVTVAVLGTPTSPPNDKAGMTFSFTVQ